MNWYNGSEPQDDGDYPEMTSDDIADMVCGKVASAPASVDALARLENLAPSERGELMEFYEGDREYCSSVEMYRILDYRYGLLTSDDDSTYLTERGLALVADYQQRQAERQPADLDALKSSWRNDPCWDIEDTAGYEAYHDELLEYRQSIEKQDEQRLIDRAKAVDCSVETMRFIEMLEIRIRILENKLDNQ